LAFLESIKPVVEDEPTPAPRPRSPVRTQDDLPPPVERAQPEAASSASGIALADIKTQWVKVQKVARTYHPSLPALLEHAQARDIQGDTVILGVKNSIFKQKIDEDEKRRALEEALYEVLGYPLKIRVVVTGESSERGQAVSDLLAQDDVLAYGVDELGGEITDFDE
jgi:hypothetical protein